jgi:hypothetical protein
VLNLASNSLGELILPEGWTANWDDAAEDIVYDHTDGRKRQDNPGKPCGIIAIANAIPDMRALSTLCLTNNKLATKEAGKALAAALAGNSVLTELDVSSNSWYYHAQDKGDGVGFAKIVAEVIQVNEYAIVVILAPVSCPAI